MSKLFGQSKFDATVERNSLGCKSAIPDFISLPEIKDDKLRLLLQVLYYSKTPKISKNNPPFHFTKNYLGGHVQKL